MSFLGRGIGEAPARTRSTRKRGTPEAVICFESSCEGQSRMLRSNA